MGRENEIALKKGKYAILEHIGTSWNGEFWKARRIHDGQFVTLKIPSRKSFQETSNAKNRLKTLKESCQREIDFFRRTSGISSERKKHFAALVDVGFFKDRPVLAITPCDLTLSRWAEKPDEIGEKVPFDGDRLIEWLRQLTSVLLAVHDLNSLNFENGTEHVSGSRTRRSEVICFPSLNPDSVLLDTGKNRLYISGFGATPKTLDESEEAIRHWVEWLSPEFRMAGAKNDANPEFALSPKAHIYSLGLLVYFLVTGKRDLSEQNPISTWEQKKTPSGDAGGLSPKQKAALETGLGNLFHAETLESAAPPEAARVLPDLDMIANSFVSLTERMLSFRIKKRPTPEQFLGALQLIESYLHPRLDQLQIHLSEPVAPKVSVSATARAYGEGLPGRGEWLYPTKNGQFFQTAMQPVLSSKETSGKTRKEWKFSIPPFEAAGVYQIGVSAWVNGKKVQTERQIRVNAEKKFKIKKRTAGFALIAIALVAVLLGAYGLRNDWNQPVKKGKVEIDAWPTLVSLLERGEWRKAGKLMAGETTGTIQDRLRERGKPLDEMKNFIAQVSEAEKYLTIKEPALDQLEKSVILFRKAARISEDLPFAENINAKIRENLKSSLSTAAHRMERVRKNRAEAHYERVIALSNEYRWAEASEILEREMDVLTQYLANEKYIHLLKLEQFWSFATRGDDMAMVEPVTLESLDEALKIYEQAMHYAVKLPNHAILSEFVRRKLEKIELEKKRISGLKKNQSKQSMNIDRKKKESPKNRERAGDTPEKKKRLRYRAMGNR